MNYWENHKRKKGHKMKSMGLHCRVKGNGCWL